MLVVKDPRTIAREIPGICEALFPQLTTGVISSLNRKQEFCFGIEPVSDELVSRSLVGPALLFEVAYARGEQIIRRQDVANWEECIETAWARQKNYYDAKIPNSLSDEETAVSEQVARNMVSMLSQINSGQQKAELVISPEIPGYHWVSTGSGDFSFGSTLVEVKCSSKNFSSADYRQILIYWLLSYASAIEDGKTEWKELCLLNPRKCQLVRLSADEVVKLISGGKSKIEVLELFISIISGHSVHTFST